MTLFETSEVPWLPKHLQKNRYVISCGSLVPFTLEKLWITKAPDFKWNFFQSSLICTLCHWAGFQLEWKVADTEEAVCIKISVLLEAVRYVFLASMFLFSLQVFWHPQKMFSLKTYLRALNGYRYNFCVDLSSRRGQKFVRKKIRNFLANMVFFQPKYFEIS